MRYIVALMAMAGSLAARAEVHSTQTVFFTKSIAPCDFWTWQSSPGGSFYACTSYPMRMEVPDAMSLQQVMNNLETRIAALEARLEEKVKREAEMM